MQSDLNEIFFCGYDFSFTKLSGNIDTERKSRGDEMTQKILYNGLTP